MSKILVTKLISCFFFFIFLLSCSKVLNNPYSPEQLNAKVASSIFSEAPKTLDSVRSYSANEWVFASQVYEPPLEYARFKFPYELQPLALAQMPTISYLDENNKITSRDKAVFSLYTLQVKENLEYAKHPAFANNIEAEINWEVIKTPYDFPKLGTRAVIADDFIYAIKRMGYVPNYSPLLQTMANYIVGLDEFSKQAVKLVADEDGFVDLNQLEIKGVIKLNERSYQIKIKGVYPQFLYWLSINFFAPMPYEVVKFYKSKKLKDKNISLKTYPVGSGPFVLSEMNPNWKIILTKNQNYRKNSFYPTQLPAGVDTADAGLSMPFLDKVIFYKTKEFNVYWNKFLQGYYDSIGVNSNNFDQTIEFDDKGKIILKDNIKSRNIYLQASVGPSIFYMGFNMKDKLIGGYSKKQKKLRAALSIAIDYKKFLATFYNAKGKVAKGPVPPGIFGFDEEAFNPVIYKKIAGKLVRKTLSDAKKLLAEAGYPNGVNPKTNNPLQIYFDIVSSQASGSPSIIWYVQQFKKLGIDLIVRATDYNRFQDKVKNAQVQIFTYGWSADYPDPENFLFLLISKEAAANKKGGLNYSNYENKKFDDLFEEIKTQQNTPERFVKIQKMVHMLQEDSPWVWGFHPEYLVLRHSWYKNSWSNPMVSNGYKYINIDVQKRQRYINQYNQPRMFLFYLSLGVLIILMTLGCYYYRQSLRIRIKKI